MAPFKTILSTVAVAATLGVSGLALTPVSASAYVACNKVECWHVDSRYKYRPAYGVVTHPDDWYFHRDWAKDRSMSWRDHRDGRGYYRNGVWVTF